MGFGRDGALTASARHRRVFLKCERPTTTVGGAWPFICTVEILFNSIR
jgi:hypothetical protein